MNLNEVVEKFRKYPANMGCGSGKLAKRYDTTPEIVKQAREIVRKEVKEDFIYEVKSIVKEMVGITELETDHSSGAQKFQVNSDKPLSPKEIEEMVGVDNISTFVDRSWLKSHKNGTWTYSVLTICKIKDFYNAAELDKRLKELFDDSYGTELNYDPRPSDKALFVYIADDHAGLVLKDSLYGKEYSSSIYQCRLETVAQEIKNLDKHFQELYIIRLGDEMDGYNGKTTRYDHDLGSLSNKEQFDIYTTANKQFYNSVFSSGVANNYHLITLSNSNHCFPDYVEVLTNNGFKLIRDVLDDDLIGSMNGNNELVYDLPTDKIYNRNVSIDLHIYKSKNISIDVTDEHRMYHKSTKSKTYNYTLSKDLVNYTSCFNFKQSLNNNNKDYNIDDNLIRLAAWIGSDGSVRQGHEYIIHQREEKCHYIKDVLDSLKIGYDLREVRQREITHIQGVELKSKNKKMFRFHMNRNHTDMSTLLKLKTLVPYKYTLPEWLNELSKRQFDIYLNTFILGDGHRKKEKGFKINSASIYGTKSVLDQLQILCIKNNHRARIKNYRKNDHVLLITFDTEKSLVDPNKNQIATEPYVGDTWCFTTLHSNLIVRNNGFVSVQGNSGKGFSHMANKALEFWLEAKYPFVNVSQQDRFIDVITFGNHIIGLTHGKDEQFMKSPLPLNLDYKTDLWLMEYYKRYVHDGAFVSTIKGDIHKFNMNQGKSGRYVNVPAISTGSAWVEHNFGDSEAGVVMEIYTANNKNVTTIPVWF